ncbi:MAG: TorF family putative porin [Phycisphaeraceae bacterium]
MKNRIAQLACVGAVAGMFAVPSLSLAQDAAPAQGLDPAGKRTQHAPPEMAPAEAGPNTGRISLSAGVDAVTEYIFRGVVQENQGAMLQPYASVSFSLFQGQGAVQDISLVTGIWNSFHTDPTGFSGAWYEADLSAGVAVKFLEKFTASIAYIWYTYPDANLTSYDEIDLKLAYDDTGMLPEIAGQQISLQPYVLLAFELNDPDGVPSAREEAQYLEIGVAPSFTFGGVAQDYPITLSLPVAIGLSWDGYYPDPAGGSSDFFGFISGGAVVSVPLAFIPSDFGQWNAHAGVIFYYLGENAAALATPGIIGAGGNQFRIVGTFGVAMSY